MMTAIMTDLHANREAVSACIAHAERQGVDRFAFLGDFVGYGPDPAWVIDTVMDYCAKGSVALCGNHDAAVLMGARKDMNPDAAKVVEWTRGQLLPHQLDWMGRLPMTIEEDDVLYVHANAWAPDLWEYIHGTMDASRSIHATKARVTFVGHVHEPALYHVGANGRPADFEPVPNMGIRLSQRRRWLIIPGASGQPRDGNPAACYATYDDLNEILTFFRVPYDYEVTAAKVAKAGLPQRLGDRLAKGG